MRLWSLLLASSCSLSHSSLSFSPGNATPSRRDKPEGFVWLARVTEDIWGDAEDGEKMETKQRGNKQVVKEKQKEPGENWTDGWRVSASLEQKHGLCQTQHPANISSPMQWWNSSLPIKETAPWINKENSISVSHMGPKETDSYWWDYVACVIPSCATSTKKNKIKQCLAVRELPINPAANWIQRLTNEVSVRAAALNKLKETKREEHNGETEDGGATQISTHLQHLEDFQEACVREEGAGTHRYTVSTPESHTDEITLIFILIK